MWQNLFLKISKRSEAQSALGVFCKKRVLRNFAKFIGIHLYQSLSLNKFAKNETLGQVLSCEFWEISRTLFPTEHLQWLLLTVWTLKNYQSYVTLKNECKQLGYYFPNEIKISIHSNEKIKKAKTVSKVWNIFIKIYL